MWAASARSDRLPVARAATTSTARKELVSPKTAQSRFLWRELGVWPGCTARGSAGVGQHHSRLALTNPLTVVEARARFEREAERSHRPVQLGRARLHLEDREDAAVGL